MSEDAERAGLVYEHFDANASDDGSTNVTPLAEYDPSLQLWWGLDEGWEHPSVCLLLQRKPDGTIVVFDEVYERHLEHDRFLDCVHQPGGLDGASEETLVPYGARSGAHVARTQSRGGRSRTQARSSSRPP